MTGRVTFQHWCLGAEIVTGLFVLGTSIAGMPLQTDTAGRTRPFHLEESIQMSRLAAPDDGAAYFSPDGARFAVVVKNGNLTRNTNDFSLLLYRTTEAFADPQPQLLARMSSSSDRDAIQGTKWLGDNRTMVFLGESTGSLPQVYSVDVRTKHIRQLTFSRDAISSYDISQDGSEIVYATDPPRTKPHRQQGSLEVVRVRRLTQLMRRTCSTEMGGFEGQQLYVQHRSQKPVFVSLAKDYIAEWGHPLSMSPDGRHALVGVLVREIPPDWSEYQNARVQQRVTQPHPAGQPIFFLERYLLLDLKKGSYTPLLNTPMTEFAPTRWSKDSKSLFLRDTFLPLDTSDPVEREERTRKTYDVEVRMDSLKVTIATRSDWPQDANDVAPLHVFLHEDRNTPPKIYVSQGDGKPRQLLDLNPWLASIQLAHVDVLKWQGTDGRARKGELFLPPGYVRGRRYPLVIQTHGFAPQRFLIDGPFESSAFAGQALAARNLLVLQMDYDRSVANTPQEGPTEMAAYEGAIDELDRQGLIDRERVGIIGFSRTVFQVAYALTHSNYKFRAASLVDGIDAGYMQYLVYGPGDGVHLNGGQPFGNSLGAWLTRSPSFRLENVRTPVRLEAHGCSQGILGSWEWFAILSDLGRPVELTYFADAPHIIVRPREKLAAEREAVDWFSFWLKDEVQDPRKESEPYRRWEPLREKQQSIGSRD